MIACENCGKEFESERAKNVHHTKIHKQENALVTVQCDYCDSVFETQESKRDISNKNFCDDECFSLYRKNTNFFSGENHPSYNRVELGCENCNQTFQVPKSRESEARFCGKECFAEWRSENMVGENSPNWKGGDPEIRCEICNELFTVARGKADRQRFCSRECWATWHSTDTDNRINYGENWTEARNTRLEKDNYQCRSCGMTREEHYEKYGFDLTVHHVIPIRKFSNSDDAHYIENLVTACMSCHRRYEGLPVFPACA